MWRDLFELNIALREASRRLHRPGDLLGHRKDRARHERPGAGRDDVQRNPARAGRSGDRVHSQIKIVYTSSESDEAPRAPIEPREIKVLNGHTYVRAYCTTREAWRTFRVDRIKRRRGDLTRTASTHRSRVANWLTQVGEEGDEVVVVIEPTLVGSSSRFPVRVWRTLKDGRHAVKFRVS